MVSVVCLYKALRVDSSFTFLHFLPISGPQGYCRGLLKSSPGSSVRHAHAVGSTDAAPPPGLCSSLSLAESKVPLSPTARLSAYESNLLSAPLYFLSPTKPLETNFLLSSYYVLDTVMNILNILYHLILTTYDGIILPTLQVKKLSLWKIQVNCPKYYG